MATLNAPIGIDYHPPTNSLIVSFNHPTGNPKNFRRIASNGAASDWSNLGGIGDPNGEIKLGIVQTTANGFTAGDLYFGAAQPGKIGKITADGSGVFTNWATLTGDTNLLLGGFHVDRTGVFGGDLIVVTGSGGVWRVTAATNATKVAQINGASSGEGTVLEGVLTVFNDPCKYGPWAGKILTCAEHENLLCAVDTNGTVAVFNLGIGLPEDVDLVVTNQNLFCLNFVSTAPATSAVLKVPKTLLTNFVDDLLIVEENTATLVIVHWDGVRFVTRRLSVPGASSLEHVSFAPIEAQP